MSRRKLGSRILQTAIRRLSSMKSIDNALDLGSSLTVPRYEKAIDGLSDKLETYNKLLSRLDRLKKEIKVDEIKLGDLSEQMLMGVGCMFGKDSFEYEQAGGTRKSDRRRSTRPQRELPASG